MSKPGKTPRQVAWECLGAHRVQNWTRLRALLHPHARIGTFAGGGRPEDPETAIARLREAHADFLYQADVLEGRVQYRQDRGWADSERTWLYVVRDELLYRSAVYRSSDLARAEYEA